MATLGPPPTTSDLAQSGKASPPWTRWLQQLWEMVRGLREEMDALEDGDVNTVATDPGGRLSLASGTPVTTTDVTGATTVYYVPLRHDKVPIYNGATWALHSIGSGISQATTDSTKSPAAVAANSNYDLFVWLDGSTVTLSRGPLWSSATSRGSGAGTTELEQVDGRWVNRVAITNGPAAQRGLYVGTIRSDGLSQARDSAAHRHVWNTYNRVRRVMRVIETSNSWNYTTDVWRQANNTSANQLDYVQGLAGDPVSARAVGRAENSTATPPVAVSVGVDSTSSPNTTDILLAGSVQATANGVNVWAEYEGHPGIGRHFLAWLEWSQNAGTTTWWGDAGTPPTAVQSGIVGHLMA